MNPPALTRRPAALLVTAVLLFAALPAAAQDARRPRIGLALSGGGARGCAHVGVLKVLEELHVPVDAIAGTSMGAVVGGLYAAGYSADEIDTFITSRDWDDTLDDKTAYRDLTFRRKEDERRYLTDIDVGLTRRGFALPAGLRSGQKLSFLLQSYLQPVAHVTDFDHLPVPFRAVAADLEDGSTVVLAGGQLETAIRASMSIPAYFTPVDVGGRLLVDGGIAINLPVEIVRAMGVDVVIAVDISEPLMRRDEIEDLVSVTSQTLNMLTRRNVEEQIAQLRDGDVLLVPDVQDFGPLAFQDARPIIDAGEAAARASLDALAALGVAEGDYADHAARVVQPYPPQRIASIRVQGQQRVDERAIRARLDVRAGDALDFATLDDDLARLFGLGVFEHVRYEVVEEASGGLGLVVHVREKAYGPTYVRLGLQLESDLLGDTAFTGLINVTRTLLNARGGEWRTELRFGRDQGALTELYQPLDFRRRFFFAPWAELITQTQPFWVDGDKMAELRSTGGRAGLDVGGRFGRHGELRLGFLAGTAETRVATGVLEPGLLDEERLDRNGLRLRFVSDSTDNPSIPRRGALVESALFVSKESLGSDLDYERLEVRATAFASRGRSTFLYGLEGGSDLGSTLPFFDQFRFGGLLSFGGFAEEELRAPRYAVARLGYHHRLVENVPGLGSGLFAGGVVEAGDLWQDGEDVDFNDLRTSVSVFLAADTFFGPLVLGYGIAEGGSDSFYLNLGHAF